MRLDVVFEEIFATLDAADIGLNVPSDGPGVRGGLPAPYAELPEITYGDGGRGLDRIEDLGLMIVFGPATNAATFKLALQHASSGGPKSVEVILQSHVWVSCGTLFVRRAVPSLETERGGNPALAYTFHIDITGRPG